jgi:Zn-dependent metalloprotease
MKKKKRKKMETKTKIIATLAALLAGAAILSGVFFVEKGKVAGEANQSSEAKLEEFKEKVGPDAEYAVNKNTGAVRFVSATKDGIPLPFKKLFSVDPATAAKYFMQEYGKYLGLEKPAKELLFVGKKSDEKKMNHLAYVQKHEGVPVFGTYAIVHLKENNSVSSVGAKFLPGIFSETKPKISRERAKKEAEKYWEDWGHIGKPESNKPTLFVFNKGLVENKKDDAYRLVWMVELWNKDEGGREYFFINAIDGSFVYHLSGTRNLNRRVFDGNSGAYVLSRSEGQGAAGVADVDNAYSYLGGAHNYFLNTFGRNGANSQGGFGDGYTSAYANTDAYVRVNNNPNKVYECPNAWYDYYSIKFCEGELTSDILGHEYGHGVTYNSILYYGWPWGFDYTGESGAIDEGYADIFGEFTEKYISGSNDWLLGAGSDYGTIRSLSDPGSMGYPEKMSDSSFYCGDWDYGGVHTNSTVFGHSAYLAAAGGTFNGYSIAGVGTDATGQIYYRALNYYLGSSSSFEDAYSALGTSCSDLYGAGSATCAEVQKALLAVELNNASPCEGGDTALIVSDTDTLSYSDSKKTKTRLNLTVSGISVSKKKHLKVRLGGRKVKVKGARLYGSSTIVNVLVKYGKWPRGEYGATVTYKQKSGNSWQRGTVSEDGVLSII